MITNQKSVSSLVGIQRVKKSGVCIPFVSESYLFSSYISWCVSSHLHKLLYKTECSYFKPKLFIFSQTRPSSFRSLDPTDPRPKQSERHHLWICVWQLYSESLTRRCLLCIIADLITEPFTRVRVGSLQPPNTSLQSGVRCWSVFQHSLQISVLFSSFFFRRALFPPWLCH